MTSHTHSGSTGNDGDLKDDLKRTGQDLADAASKTAETARERLSDAAESARDAAQSRAEGARDTVAGEVGNFASALRRASDEMRDGSPQERTFAQVADGLADISDRIRGKDLGEMVDDVSDFARRNPAVFLGGMALIGFAAARFAKASTPEQDTQLPARSADTLSPPPSSHYAATTAGGSGHG